MSSDHNYDENTHLYGPSEGEMSMVEIDQMVYTVTDGSGINRGLISRES